MCVGGGGVIALRLICKSRSEKEQTCGVCFKGSTMPCNYRPLSVNEDAPLVRTITILCLFSASNHYWPKGLGNVTTLVISGGWAACGLFVGVANDLHPQGAHSNHS